MSNKDTISCWACNSIEDTTLINCSNCGMPLSQADSSQDDLDDFLDEFTSSEDTEPKSPVLPEIDESPSIPDFPDGPELPSFEESVALPETDASPSMPDFPDSPEIPSFDVSPVQPELEMEGSEETIQSPSVADIDIKAITKSVEEDTEVLESPELPSFDEFGLDFEDEVVDKGLDETRVVYTSILGLGLIKQLKLYLSLGIYWYIVFFIISIASFEITEPNVNIDSQNGGGILVTDYKIYPQAFLFAWISFIVMGWFFGYKLHQFGIERTFKNGILLLLTQFLILTMMTLIGFTFVNGSLATINLEDSILLSLILFTWYNYLVSMLTFGLLGFFVSFGLYWNAILNQTTRSKITT